MYIVYQHMRDTLLVAFINKDFVFCCLSFCTRAGNAIFTALEQSQEAIEITSEDQVIQVSL